MLFKVVNNAYTLYKFFSNLKKVFIPFMEKRFSDLKSLNYLLTLKLMCFVSISSVAEMAIPSAYRMDTNNICTLATIMLGCK